MRISVVIILLALHLAELEAASLKSCLQQAGLFFLTGLNGSSYDQARLSLTKYSDSFPSAIVYPTTQSGVSLACKCASQYRMRVHPRSGGHGNEGETVENGAMTIDLRNMSRVTLSADKETVVFQAGATLGQLAAQILIQSNMTRSFPIGQRPTVGIGYILGGGFGALTRYAGLGADQVISMKAVDSSGKELVINAASNPDLFWALRGGGGGNLVIVTEFTTRTVDISMGVTSFTYSPPKAKVFQVMSFYQRGFDTLPSTFTTRVDGSSGESSLVGRKSGLVASVTIEGWCVDTLVKCQMDMAKALAANAASPVKETSFTWAHGDYLTALAAGIGWPIPPQYNDTTAGILAAIQDRDAWPDRSYYKYKTMLLSLPLPSVGVNLILDYFAEGGIFEYQSLGGKMKSFSNSAVNLRNASQVLIFKAIDPTGQDNETLALAMLHKTTALVEQLSILMGQNKYKAYVNFLDTDVPLFTPSWEQSYYGSTTLTLACIKQKFDPLGVYQNPLQYGSLVPLTPATRLALNPGQCNFLINQTLITEKTG